MNEKELKDAVKKIGSRVRALRILAKDNNPDAPYYIAWAAHDLLEAASELQLMASKENNDRKSCPQEAR